VCIWSGNEEMIRMAEIVKGVQFILGHFNSPIYPRRIFTPIEKQVTVYSIDEIITKFKAAEFEDCRISAYPYYGQKQHWYLGYEKPDLLFIDLDVCQFKNTAALNRALKKTLDNIKTKLCCAEATPTILESGSGGYHIIQPLEAPDLKRMEAPSGLSKEPNKDFIRFLEPFISPKADPNHYQNVSLNNCLLRVPGSINLKVKTEVKVKQRWNGIRPHIRYVYANFLAYLMDNKEEQRNPTTAKAKQNKTDWIQYCSRKGGVQRKWKK
jgi:hypothetical protein